MTARQATALLAFGQTVAWAGLFYVFPALLPRFEAAFAGAGPPPALGLTLALAAAALCAPAAGRLVDRGFAPAMMPLAALLGAAALAGAALSASPWLFLALWGVIGVACAGALYEPAFALLTRTRGAQARGAIASVTLVAGFASTLAFPLAGWIEATAGWRAAAGAMAAVTAGLAAPALFLAARALERRVGAARAAAGASRRSWARALRRPGVARVALAFSASALLHGMLLAHLLPILLSRGIAGAAALGIAALIGPMQVGGRLALLAAPRRWPAAALSAAAFAALAAAALALLAAGVAPGFAFLFVALQGAAFGATTILRPATLAEAFGTEGFGALSGAVAVPYMGAFAAAPVLGAALRAWGGADLVIAAAMALALVALLAMAPLARAR